ncbi:APC family permease [Nesterenkonia sp. CF4.4]|uniref:APC family permease n=1 Tax=Nesterenkonia sp. CF4.4 TaxID=3373079 RepID=UPI003EE66807
MTEHAASTRPTAEEETALAKRTLGVPALVFLIIAASAPLTVLAGGATTSFAITAQTGVPVGYLLLGVILGLFAVGYGRMSTYVQNAGAFYAYVAAGLGTRPGIGTAFLALMTYNAMQIGIYGVFGFTASSIVDDLFGVTIAWWICALAGWALVAWLGVNRIDLSAKVLAVIVLLEFLVVIVVSLLSLTSAPEGITAETLLPENWMNGSLGALLAFGMAAFMGFESGAIYSEEAKNPERSVARATYIAVAIIALFYAASSWALAVGIGPSQIVAQAQEWGPDLVFVFLDGRLPAMLVNLAAVLFLTSIMAALVAFHNAAARYFFSMGRARIMPGLLAHTGARSGAPIAGSLLQSGLGLTLIIVFAIAGSGSELGPLFPVLTMFPWLTNAAGFGLVLLLCITSVAVLRYFNREPERHPLFVRTVAPLLAAIGLGLIAALIMFNFDVMIDSSSSSALVVILPGAIVGSGVVGLLWAQYLRVKRPEIYRGVSRSNIG